MSCVLCGNNESLTSIEHIIPESMGNKRYILPAGYVCKTCNNIFSKFEREILSNTIIGFERARFANRTKKGKLPNAKVGEVTMSGTQSENIIKLSGITSENIKNSNPRTGVFQVTVPGFQGNEMVTAKFLLKVSYLSLFKSRRKLFQEYDFSSLKDYLLNKSNLDWPFVTTQKDIYKFESIPSFTDKYFLKILHLKLLFCQLNPETLLFRFEYGGFMSTINLLNRNTEWLKIYNNMDNEIMIYPEYIKRKIN